MRVDGVAKLRTGMILEKIDGKQPSKRLNESSFNDIHYVEELLFCVFNALDIGQKSLGFHHSGEAKKKKKKKIEKFAFSFLLVFFWFLCSRTCCFPF